jgi:uncharacterized protein YbcI
MSESDEDPDGGLEATESDGARGTMLANVSRRMVMLYKESYGKGPTQARTYYQDDTVLVLLRGGFTRVEETLLRDGRGAAVHEQRAVFQQVMHDRFVEIVEEEIGRRVVAFMSTTHQEPDLNAELFVLEPAQPDEQLAVRRRGVGEGRGRRGLRSANADGDGRTSTRSLDGQSPAG